MGDGDEEKKVSWTEERKMEVRRVSGEGERMWCLVLVGVRAGSPVSRYR
jgi:hypothetical protein